MARWTALRARRRSAGTSLAAQVFAVQAVIALVVVASAAVLTYRLADRQVAERTRVRVLDVAHVVAADADVAEAVTTADPSATLQPLAERYRTGTGTDFVVVMSPTGTRWSHPNPALIGQTFVGHIADAAAGGEVVERYTGSLGPSTRAVVPVRSGDRVVALVAVGLTEKRREADLRAVLPGVVLAAGIVALVSGLGAGVVAWRVRRQTLGLNARELQRLYDHHEAVLHAVREGLIIVDRDDRVQVINDEARRLLGLGEEVVGRRVDELGLAPSLTAALQDRHERTGEQHAAAGRIVVLAAGSVVRNGRATATLFTLRDRTEMQSLLGELDSARGLADALHAQAHESANRLHTVVSLVELGRPDDAVRFATEELAATQRLTDAVVHSVADPATSALLLGKIAQAAERGVTLEVDPEAHLPEGLLPSRDVVTILGNLIDNAIDALADVPPTADRRVSVDLEVDDHRVRLTVADTGPGLGSTEAQAFQRGWSTKAADAPGGRGLGLALVQQTATRLGGTVQVGDAHPGAVFTIEVPVAQSVEAS